jgi:hypothetical protein
MVMTTEILAETQRIRHAVVELGSSAWRQAFMVPIRLAFVFVVLGVLTVACNSERTQECDRFLGATEPIQEGMPSADTVDRVNKDVGALTLRDQPLHIYAENDQHTLTVLTNTLRLKATPDAPDGTDDVVKHNLQEARTDRDDVARYCAN